MKIYNAVFLAAGMCLIGGLAAAGDDDEWYTYKEFTASGKILKIEKHVSKKACIERERAYDRLNKPERMASCEVESSK